jgi:hypothetical protein
MKNCKSTKLFICLWRIIDSVYRNTNDQTATEFDEKWRQQAHMDMAK